jgi:hypothetical protein
MFEEVDIENPDDAEDQTEAVLTDRSNQIFHSSRKAPYKN